MEEDSTMALRIFKSEVVKVLEAMSGLSTEKAEYMLEGKYDETCEFSVTMQKALKFGLKNLDQLADEWASKFVPNEYVESVQVRSVGENRKKITCLKFKCPTKKLAELTLTTAFTQDKKYGSSNTVWKDKTVVIEYSSPNIAKPFHAGHLRSTIIGNFIHKLYKFFGAKTFSINYLGDWGTQYGILSVGYEKYGDEVLLHSSPIKHLFDVYVKINADISGTQDSNGETIVPPNPELRVLACEYFKKMELGDEYLLSLWSKFREYSIIEYKKIYKRLNVNFDVYAGESEASSLIQDSILHLEKKNLIKIAENNAKMVDLSEFKLGKIPVVKADGATLYITRDIGTLIGRNRQYNFDSMIYVVSSQQDQYLQQLIKIMQLCGFEWHSKILHINYGMVMGMKTRKGKVVFLESILDMAKEVMLNKIKEDSKGKMCEIENIDQTADILGVSAVVVQDFSSRRIKDYEFCLKLFTSFEGNTGPYLQYTHSRLCSMMDNNSSVPLTSDFDYSLLSERIAHQLIVLIARFPLVTLQCLSNHEPSTLVSYMFELCKSISLAHSQLRIKNTQIDLAIARKMLFYSARIVLYNALTILGLEPLKRV